MSKFNTVGSKAKFRHAKRWTLYTNFLMQEYNFTDLHSEIFPEPIQYENGFIAPPTGPHLGIELNEKVVQR
ncbi:MAG: hypothetical protein R2828_17470 [Saprospiraceae bacterium]